MLRLFLSARTRAFRRTLALASAPLFAAACKPAPDVAARDAAAVTRATLLPAVARASMVDTLAKLYAEAVADPRRNAFLNRERADALESLVAMQVGQDAMQGRYLVAQERLLAGQTREAIDGLETLQRAANIRLDASLRQNKPFFDLLAVAYFRLGEQENCFLDMAANMCILPLAGSARHTRQEGARKAIALYDQMLRAFPDDRGSAWLLNLAHLAVGEYPKGVPPTWRIPDIDRRRPNALPQFTNVAHAVGLDVNGLSGGVSIADFDHDGNLDLFTTSFGLNDKPHFFASDGHGGYVDRTDAAGIARIVGGLNNVHADYDNDGFEDVFVMRGAWLGEATLMPNSLLHNRGDGTFEDVSYDAGIATRHPTPTAAWADFNLDGRLDLFVGHESGVAQGGASHPSELFLNEGNGHFKEVSRAVGIDVDAFVKGATWGDYDNDGLPDLYLSLLYGPNRLFHNRGGTSLETWRFEEVPNAAGAALPAMSFPTWFWDFDQDGWEDLLVLSYDIRNSGALHDAVATEYLRRAGMVRGALPVEPSRLFRNNHDGTFRDVTHEVGLDDKVIFAMGANFGDLDNDGWLDFYVGTGNPDLRSVIPNRMFHSVGGKRFEEVTLEGGFGHLQKGHATAFVDLDRDGDEDVFMVMGGAYSGDRFASALYENPGVGHRPWISLELEGRTANRSAIGARIAVMTTDASGGHRTLYRTVNTGGSFGSGTLEQHIGLGDATRVDSVRITWPDVARSTTTYGSLALRGSYHIVQGLQPTVVTRTPMPFRQTAVAPHDHR